MTLLDRYQGCLLGLAAGDALGTTQEFKPPGTFDPIDDMVGGGPFALQPGEWTDDTSMALCLAESLLKKRGFDPVDQMVRYTRWWKGGHFSSNGRCFDIGNTVRSALIRFSQTKEGFCGSEAPNTAGNGSIMRLAPVPLFHAGDPDSAIHLSGESSRTTHGARACIDACRYMAALIVSILEGRDRAEWFRDGLLIDRFFGVEPLCPEIERLALGSFLLRSPPAIRGTGYVVDSLEAALWAFARAKDFRDGALLAVNLGDDADTTGAVYGQIAGAHFGRSGIPPSWLEKLVRLGLIESLAERLLEEGSNPGTTLTKEG